MNEQIRYSISDELKRLMSEENETVFRMMENRFCVDIQSPLLRFVTENRLERGRSLKMAFKMFLTHLGSHCKAIIASVHGISHIEFQAPDAHRHRLMKNIFSAYEKKRECE